MINFDNKIHFRALSNEAHDNNTFIWLLILTKLETPTAPRCYINPKYIFIFYCIIWLLYIIFLCWISNINKNVNQP